MAMQSLPARGRPRIYLTEEERAEARREKVRLNVQAFRKRQQQGLQRKQNKRGIESPAWARDKPRPRTSHETPHSRRQLVYITPSPSTRPGAQQPCLILTSDTDCDRGLDLSENEELIDDLVWEMVPQYPRTLLSAAAYDPFASTWGRTDISASDHELLDHALSYQWSVFRSNGSPLGVQCIKSDVMATAMSSPVSYYAVLFAAATHHTFRCGQAGVHLGDQDRLARLAYKTKAIGFLKEEISRLQQKSLQNNRAKADSQSQLERSSCVTDELLLSMVTLAAHGTGEDIIRQPSSHNLCDGMESLSLLGTAQDLHYYSSMQPEMAHVEALVILIQQRGGLGTIKIAGLAYAIALFDIFLATLAISQPLFPLLVPSGLAMADLGDKLFQAGCTAPSRGHGFDDVLCTGSNVLHEQLLDVLQDLQLIATAFSWHSRPRVQDSKISNASRQDDLLMTILQARKVVQHDLLSLPRHQTSHDTNVSLAGSRRGLANDDEVLTYEICRTATLLYSIMVTFPIPGSPKTKKELVRQLTGLLKQWQPSGMLHPSKSDMAGIFAWACMLCAVGANEKKMKTDVSYLLNQHFEVVRDDCGKSLPSLTWSEASQWLSLHEYLWWNTAHDRLGEKFWLQYVNRFDKIQDG